MSWGTRGRDSETFGDLRFGHSEAPRPQGGACGALIGQGYSEAGIIEGKVTIFNNVPLFQGPSR